MESNPDHISLRRLWDFKEGVLKLDLREHAHILDCARCSDGFRACIQAQTYEEAQERFQANHAPD